MLRVERTLEERRLFYDERTDILDALTDVQDYDRQSNKNEAFMTALVDTLRDCKNLVPICGNLAGLVVRQGTVRMGPEKGDPERRVTIRDIRVLGSALWSLLKEIEAKTPKTSEGKPEQTPEIIKVRRAISRINPVQLFYSTIYGEPFKYRIRQDNSKNNIPVFIQREQFFGGIPEEKRPRRPFETRRENAIMIEEKIDLGIYPENAKRIYEILKALEVEEPKVNQKNGNKGKRIVNRAGEAEFFLKHLPKGLKPWAETDQTK